MGVFINVGTNLFGIFDVEKPTHMRVFLEGAIPWELDKPNRSKNRSQVIKSMYDMFLRGKTSFAHQKN